MYLPDVYRVEDSDKINQFVDHYSFADFITYESEDIMCNKVPFLFDKEQAVLYGHIGRGNPQLQAIEQGAKSLIIFSGEHCYVSPQWYESKNAVPTWNFQSLQVRGRVQLLPDDKIIHVLKLLTAKHEAQLDSAWTMDEMDARVLDKMVKQIAAFQVCIERLEFKEKMSQIRSEKDRISVIKYLSRRDDVASQGVAKVMSRNLDKT